MSKVCGNCRYFVTTGSASVCTLYCSGTSDGECCRNHEEKRLFDRITASPEVLAEKLMYEMITVLPMGLKLVRYRSTLVSGAWKTKAEAIAATVAELNSPAATERKVNK